MAYPSGPEPSGDSRLIKTASDPVLVVLYLYWALVAAALLAWAAIRILVSRSQASSRSQLGKAMDVEMPQVARRSSPRSAPGSPRRGHDDDDDGEEHSPKDKEGQSSKLIGGSNGESSQCDSASVRVQVMGSSAADGGALEGPHATTSAAGVRCVPYKDSALGRSCFWLLCTTSGLWMVLYLVGLLDFYWGCQLRGVDALCFFGSYPLSGSYEANSAAFVALWLVCLAWYGTLLACKKRVRNWFRVPCSPRDAQFVWVWVPQAEEKLAVAGSWPVAVARALKAALGLGSSGYEVTAPVEATPAGTRFYMLQARRYVLDEARGTFGAATSPSGICVRTYGDLLYLGGGLMGDQVSASLDACGPNKIPFDVEPLLASVANELFTPFYLYQLLVYMSWMWYSYLVVGALLACVVLGSAAAKIYIKRRNQRVIAQLTKYRTGCEVLRNGLWTVTDSEELVVGDAIRVKSEWILPCDCVLLQGTAVCNESALTGEAMPVQKAPFAQDQASLAEEYSSEGKGKRHTLFAGTTVLQAANPSMKAVSGEEYTTAIVTATGISTGKGDILSAILFPTRMVFRYDEELPVVIAILFVEGLVQFCLILWLSYVNGTNSILATKFVLGIFAISQILSPLLPVALIAGQVKSTLRLSKQGLFCINPHRIAISGKVRVYCFDKTGTLTSDSLAFHGVREAQPQTTQQEGSHQQQGAESPLYCLGEVVHPTPSSPVVSPRMMSALATCHALARYEDHLVGNQVEVEMFKSTGWALEESGNEVAVRSLVDLDNRLKIVRRFEFDHARQSMSVVVEDAEGRLCIYSKGSFEKVAAMCQPETLPSDYMAQSQEMAMDGCYVLGVAFRELPIGTDTRALDRDTVEQGLTLCGLLAFRNELKPMTAQAIGDLKRGEVRPVMITGDNAQCGHYIAGQCGMAATGSKMLLASRGDDGQVTWAGMTMEEIESEEALRTGDLFQGENLRALEAGELELAVTGAAYDDLVLSGDMDRLLLFTRVFARMTPANKVEVVQMFVRKGLVVGMCGDGGNDCGALRVAHVGVALSEAEASVVSPFTSKSKCCTSVVDLLKEGKCALHTNLASYKYLILYGQLFCVWKLSMMVYGTIPAMLDYLMMDIVAVVLLTYAITLSGPRPVLSSERPTSSLFSATTLGSVLGILTIYVLFFAIIFLSVVHMPGYTRWPSTLAAAASWWLNGDNWESTAVFFPLYFMFITSGIILGFGAKYRKPVYSNPTLVASFVLLFLVGEVALLSGPNFFTRPFHVASEQFNHPQVSIDSPESVWAKYHEANLAPGEVPCAEGGDHEFCSSPAMSGRQRWFIFIMTLLSLLLAAGWQHFVIDTKGRAAIRSGRFPGLAAVTKRLRKQQDKPKLNT